MKIRNVLAVVVLAGSGLVALGTSAQAATPTCNGRTMRHRFIQTSDGHLYTGQAGVPSYGSSFDCLLPSGTNTGTDLSTSPVFWLQYTLNHCYGAGLVQDGSYGPNTKAAVVAAQRAAGVTPDGVYGPQTRNAIKWYVETQVSKTLKVSVCAAWADLY